MEFIQTIPKENEICSQSLIGKRKNSPKIDYMNKINDKPWGKEYLAYQSDKIGIWILHVNRDQETSLHCHFKKDTILMPISGCFKINLFDRFRILHNFESIYVPRNTFHGIHSYTEDAVLMEIEIYTDVITYTDKNDLLRIKDMYHRDKDKYETSITERAPNLNEAMDFSSPNIYSIGNTNIEIRKVRTLEGLKQIYDQVILLEGSVYSSAIRQTAGSFLDLNKDYSLLTSEVHVLCLSNPDSKYLKKIIYSTLHLIDFLSTFTACNVGLTSGCFDILHEGHITNLKTCKRNCDHLFVCLSSDKQIQRLKGEDRPINHLADRIKMLIHFDFIDHIILYDEINDHLEIELDSIMTIIRPAIWFKGKDYTKEGILKKHPSLSEIYLIDLVQGKSTTNIINKIRT
jgi:cytidyltransferase-like protein